MKVVSYRNSTSNHNWELIIWKNRLLYLIEILHQTTTRFCILFPVYRCILSKFYIKPQLARVASYSAIRCILSKFYIKPQPAAGIDSRVEGCILSKFYIKPQLTFALFFQFIVVSYRNSTSNHNCRNETTEPIGVVSYRNSTSNHNYWECCFATGVVVSYRNSTSNHNYFDDHREAFTLYLIEILHQTTTDYRVVIKP